MGSRSQPRILEWLRMIEDEAVPSDTPEWSYPSRISPKVQDPYDKLPGIEDQLRRSTSVKEGSTNLPHLGLPSQQVAHVPHAQGTALGTYKKEPCLESVGPIPCLMSFQKAAGMGKKERTGYERRPRHKTKDDHYEYKGKMYQERDGRVTKTKRRRSAKKNRKHTMNDNFHASNVARNRLTLQSNMNLGLFQIGRTSSPVKVQGADLSFSEMKFLSYRARKDREAACIYGDKEGNGIVCRNSPNKNPRGCLTLWDTAKERAGSQASDVYPHEQSVHGHGQRNTMLQVYTNASSQLQSEGSEGISRTATAYTWSESVREYSAMDDPCEWRTRQLLSIDWDVQDNNEAIATVESPRKYWTLEELKCLLDQRKLLWYSDAYSPVVWTNESSHWRGRKRKRSQSIGEGGPAQTPKRVNKHNNENKAGRYGATSIPATNRHDPVSELPALLRSSGDTDAVSMHMLHGQPAPASPQAFDQADIIEPPTSDFTLYPGTSSFISSSLHMQKPRSVMQSHDSCVLKEAKTPTASAMIWDYDESPAQFANRVVPLPGGDSALIAQTLSAAYDVIMQPEEDPLYTFPNHRMVDTPVSDASSGVGSNGNIFYVPDDFHGLPDDLVSYWLPGFASEAGVFSHGSYDSTVKKHYLGLPQTNYAVQPQYFTGQFPETRYSAGENHEVVMAEAESRTTTAMVSGLQEALRGGLKGFWRQQKLY